MLEKILTDEKEYGDVLDGAEETANENSEIPADLEGILEDIARGIMQQSAETETEKKRKSRACRQCYHSLLKI